MEMYLAGVPVYTIILIGRWQSGAFLRYIQKQVEQFLQDIAKKMLTHDCFKQFQTSHHMWYQTKIPGRANIVITPRREEILEEEHIDGCSFRPSLSSIDQLMMWRKQLME
jgi:hypothetical protein